MRGVSYVALGLLVASQSAFPAETPGAESMVFSLRDAVKFALDHSPTLDSARRNEQIAHLSYKVALSKLLPSVDLSTTNGLQNNLPISSITSASIITPNPTAPWYSSLNLGVTENLYDNGVSLTQLKLARLGEEVAAIAAQKARDSLVQSVASEFYNYSLASVLLDVRTEQQKMLDRQYTILSALYRQGFKTRDDFLRMEAEVKNSEIAKINAEQTIAQSDANLANLLGIGHGGGPEFEQQDGLHPTYKPVEVRRDLDVRTILPRTPPPIENFYDVRSARIQSEINAGAITLAERNDWPQIQASAGVSYYNENYIASNQAFSAGNQLSWDALLTIQFNLWDWGQRRDNVAIAEQTRDTQDDALQAGLISLDSTISALMAQITRIARSYQLSRELLSLQEESERHLEEQYRDGKVTYLDLITGLSALLNAKIQFCTEYFTALQSEAQYRYYEGTLYERIMEK